MKSRASGLYRISKWKRSGLVFFIAVMVPMLHTGPLMAAGPEGPGYATVPATVKKAGRSLIAVQTETGATRFIARKLVERRGLRNLASGDGVFLVLDTGNLIVDLYRRGLHSVRGTIEKIRPTDKMMTVRLRDGKVRDYEMKENVLTKLDRVGKGALLTFEIDKQNRIMDFRLN